MSALAALLAENMLDNPMDVGSYNKVRAVLDNKRKGISLTRKKELLNLYCEIPNNLFKDIFPQQNNTTRILTNLSTDLAIAGRIAAGTARRGWLKGYVDEVLATIYRSMIIRKVADKRGYVDEALATIYCSMIIRKVADRRGTRSVDESIEKMETISREVRQCVVEYDNDYFFPNLGL